MMLNVHQLDFYDQPYLDYLRSLLPASVNLTVGAIPEPATFDLLIGARPTLAQITASPHLKGVIIPFAGVPEPTQTLLRQFPHLKVYNLHHNTDTTAEMAVALMLAAARQLIPADRIFRRHDWTPRHAPMPALTLTGKHVLILGYGHIGQKVAQICRAIGMQVSGIKRTPPFTEDIHPLTVLPALLPRTHVLMITLPLTPDTKNLIGAAEIALLPQDAVIVNVGRAEVVEEQALYVALRDQKLHGAAFDVWYQYPADVASRTHTPPASYPFHELDNMVMSPHRAGSVGQPDLEMARMEALAELLTAAANGQPLPNEVDLDKGY